MKKFICILLCFILLVAVPFKGYASSAVFFGMSEELVLGYLAALLGIQAKETITSYDDLLDYNNDLRYGFTEYLAGSATSMELAEWIGQAVIGNINTDSIIWQKFYDYCLSQYTASIEGSFTNQNGILNTPSFPFVYGSSLTITGKYSTLLTSTGIDAFVVFAEQNKAYANYNVLQASKDPVSGFTSYTYNGQTVYYKHTGTSGNIGPITVTPADAFYVGTNYFTGYTASNANKWAWSMLYDATTSSENIGSFSGAFNGVLTSIEKDAIVDGTSVLQLYNPAKSQNGLHIVPDPEDPQEIVVPAMLTADWYNYLQQFGNGAQSFVNAYNALNAVEGVSTGAINGLYNNLGIASAVNSAAAAAQGTLSLTDNNVFPQVSTVADAVTGVIPGALTPVTPDSGITNDSDQGLYKLPDLREFFPFCIPFDFIDLLSCFVADPETPEFVIALSDGSHLADQEISLESFDNIASIVRTLELALFILGLMLITRNLIRG